MKTFLKVLFAIIAALYPVLVFLFLVVFKLPVRVLSVCIIALAFTFFLSATARQGKKLQFDKRPLLSSILFLTAGLFCFFTNKDIFLRLYSVVVSATFLFVFGSSLFFPPVIVFRFATLQDKSIISSKNERKIYDYCKKVTIAWCLFFIINGLISAFTAFFCDARIWSIYNGGISYVLMGLMFTIEFIIRRRVNSKMNSENDSTIANRVFTITKFKADSRPDDYVVCYEDRWSKGVYKTWKDFLVETARFRAWLTNRDCNEYILHCEDYWYFLVAFVALLQCKKTVSLTQNISEAFLKEFRNDKNLFITDQNVLDSFSIPAILEDAKKCKLSEDDIRNIPVIDSDSTDIYMYTSGSTGKPKAVHQRMTEFEMDNAFVISKWGKEFFERKLVTTVSQHHIYGFLFGISLPFSAGVPFRRKRIEYPEEFESITDEKYMIIAVPAFLKRTVEIEEHLELKEPFIFTSGGVLLPEVAKKTNDVFGFWPVEVYGSTETSGIAYRQSKNGLEWTPFDNAKIWKGEDGCLRIISPYIKDPAGFATADLVDIHEDGKFILKGRADSIVKIEEKRVSMTEVENRLLQSGFVRDVKVVAMEDKRQYLAAALSLNEEGKKKFSNSKKLDINRFFHDFLMQYFENVVIPKKWRFVEELPCDIQGKKHKEDIIALFNKD